MAATILENYFPYHSRGNVSNVGAGGSAEFIITNPYILALAQRYSPPAPAPGPYPAPEPGALYWIDIIATAGKGGFHVEGFTYLFNVGGDPTSGVRGIQVDLHNDSDTESDYQIQAVARHSMTR